MEKRKQIKTFCYFELLKNPLSTKYSNISSHICISYRCPYNPRTVFKNIFFPFCNGPRVYIIMSWLKQNNNHCFLQYYREKSWESGNTNFSVSWLSSLNKKKVVTEKILFCDSCWTIFCLSIFRFNNPYF